MAELHCMLTMLQRPGIVQDGGENWLGLTTVLVWLNDCRVELLRGAGMRVTGGDGWLALCFV